MKRKPKKAPFKAQLTMAGTSATLDVTGMIGWDTTALSFTEKVQQAKEAGCTALTIRINSLGGYCYEGLAIGDCIRSCGMDVTCVVYGTAQSMGSYILMMGGHRVAHKNATIMIHQPSAGVCGTVDEIKAQSDYLLGMRDRMFEDMGKRCGMKGADLSAEHTTMKLYTADEALARGFIDEVTDPDKQDEPEPAPEPEKPEEPEQQGGRVFDYAAATMAATACAACEGETEPATETESTEPTETEPTETEPTETKPATEPAAPAEPAPEPPTESTPLTESRVAEMLAERDARLMAQMGVAPGALPAPVNMTAAAPATAAACPYTVEQVAKMPAMQRLAVLDANPSLAAAYKQRI